MEEDWVVARREVGRARREIKRSVGWICIIVWWSEGLVLEEV